MKFTDRKQAGKLLAAQLTQFADREAVLALCLPRGGLPIGVEIAKALACPLDLFLVRKLGLPFHPELAMGAVATGGVEVWNQAVLQSYPISEEEIKQVKEAELAELERRSKLYRGSKPLPVLKDKTIILCDDGIATGATIRAAITAIKQQQVKQLIVAVPVAPVDTYHEIAAMVDAIICLEVSTEFYAIGQFYDAFPQLADAQVIELLADFG